MKKLIAVAIVIATLSGCATQAPITRSTSPKPAPAPVAAAPKPATKDLYATLASATVTYNREIAMWGYCRAGKIVRQGAPEIGRQGSSHLTMPVPQDGEVPCFHLHTHPWEGSTHNKVVVPGPSPQDLSVSNQFPSLNFAVIDYVGAWTYANGTVGAVCPWNDGYTGIDYQSCVM
jgi:hypothetical protein